MKKNNMLLLLVTLSTIFLVGCSINEREVLTGTEEELYNYPTLESKIPDLEDHDAYEIVSFDTEDQLKSLSYRDVRGSAEVIYDAPQQRVFSRILINGIPSLGDNCWPALMLEGRSANAIIKETDFTSYDGLKLDIRNNSDRTVAFNVLIFDYNYVRYENYMVNLKANSDWTTITLPFNFQTKLANNTVSSTFTLNDIGHIEFWLFNIKEEETSIILDFDRFGFYKGAN